MPTGVYKYVKIENTCFWSVMNEVLISNSANNN